MSELEEIKRKKLEQLKKQQENQQQEQVQFQQQVEQLEGVVKQVLTKDALVRYGNIKAAHPEKAVQLLMVLGQAIQSGQVRQVDDNLLKNILKKLEPEKRDIKITRK